MFSSFTYKIKTLTRKDDMKFTKALNNARTRTLTAFMQKYCCDGNRLQRPDKTDVDKYYDSL